MAAGSESNAPDATAPMRKPMAASNPSSVESTVLEDQIVDWLLERVDVKEEAATFDGLLKAGQTTAENT